MAWIAQRPVSPRFIVGLAVFVAALVLLVVLTAEARQTELVPEGASWWYLDDGSDQGTAWREPDFDHSSWSTGQAELGYGDGDEVTAVGFGANPDQKYITTYFRHVFQVQDAAMLVRADLRLLRDDGAVVYLNGVEIVRTNLPTGDITYDTLASPGVAGAGESLFHAFAVDPAGLIEGENVLAVEVHQVDPGSSDISFDLRLSASDTVTIVTRGPYLQTATPSSVILRWRTNQAVDSCVRFGPTGAPLDQETCQSTLATEHAVTLDSLSPLSAYGYEVGSSTETFVGGDNQHVFLTSPPAGVATPTRIWVLGDSGTADGWARLVRHAYENHSSGEPPDLWLMLGDNAYYDGTDEQYQRAVFEMYPRQLRTSPLWPSLGNHDTHSVDPVAETGPYFDNFTLPRDGEAGGLATGTEKYYSFDYGNIHFVVLDSYLSSRSPTGPMLTWLGEDLAAASADWLVAYWHHPPYSKGSHDSDTETPMVEMRQYALPILEDHGVDLVLTGHSHAYERSVLLDSHYGPSDTLIPAMILDAGNGRPDEDGPYVKPTGGLAAHEGTIYVVAGSSGKLTGGPLNHPVMLHSELTLGSLILDVDGPHMDVTFLRADGIIGDWFTIAKPALGLIFADGFESADASAWGPVPE